MKTVTAPDGPVNAAITIGGSKSISNRLLVLMQLMKSSFHTGNLSLSNDTVIMQDCLRHINSGDSHIIHTGDAGTVFRFLTALLSVTPGEWQLTGSERLLQRPIAPLVNALRELGAEIHYSERGERPPLLIKGKKLRGGVTHVDASMSSQFISALMLIGAFLEAGIVIHRGNESPSAVYIDLTAQVMRECGIPSDVKENFISVPPFMANPGFSMPYEVESDWSSASYWFSICSLSAGSEIHLRHFRNNSVQPDSVLPLIYGKLGVTTKWMGDEMVLKQEKAGISSFQHDFLNCPDIAMTVAATCFGLGIPAQLTGLRTLPFKESDRIQAFASEVGKLGAKLETGKDLLRISGQIAPPAGKINSHRDHRIIMSIIPLVLKTGSLTIADEAVVNKSYPSFWQDLESAGFCHS
jgi:3-phosphoshikimate 1-carboxyvinyltransferase